MTTSIEFLTHYQCANCGWSWTTGDRYPLNWWECLCCGHAYDEDTPTTHLNLLTEAERLKFADMLENWAKQIRESKPE